MLVVFFLVLVGISTQFLILCKATKILKQDPHATNYYGGKEAGDFLRKTMSPGRFERLARGAERDDRRGPERKAMRRYFEPRWLS
jgi:peptidyl-dipeptidase A